MISDVRGRGESEAAYKTCAQVAYDVALEIGEHYYVKRVGAGNELHTEVVYNHIVSLKPRIAFSNFIKTFEE
jgi:hypothetical protein